LPVSAYRIDAAAGQAVVAADGLDGSTGAFPSARAYTGPIVLQLGSADWGTSYEGDSDTYTWDGTTWVPDTSGNNLTVHPAQGHIAGEDTWGWFAVNAIYEGEVLTPHENIGQAVGSPALWSSSSTDGKELIGMFWGEKDTVVVLEASGLFSVEGSGFKFAIWEQDAGSFAAANPFSATNTPFNSVHRGANPWDFTGIGDDASSVLWASGIGQTGFAGTIASTTFTTSFNPLLTVGSKGQGNATLSIQEFAAGEGPTGTGTANDYLNTDYFISPVTGETGDITLQFTTTSINPFNEPRDNPLKDATVSNNDPAAVNFVPEPITMLGLLIGVGSVGGYIRRRRQA